MHLGHEAVARLALDTLNLDELRFLPAKRPPHKLGLSASETARTTMLQSVVAKDPRMKIDHRELQDDRVSYTVLTLRDMRRELGPKVELYFVIGWDSLQNLRSWWCWRELFTWANVAVVGRPGTDAQLSHELETAISDYLVDIDKLKPYPNGQLVILASSGHELSSSKLRAQLENGALSSSELNRFLSQEVADYVLANGLYNFSNKAESNRYLS